MTLAPELLDILVCPKCKGDLEYRPDEAVLVCHACRLGLPDRRRHPHHADRRGQAGLTSPDLARILRSRARPRRGGQPRLRRHRASARRRCCSDAEAPPRARSPPPGSPVGRPRRGAAGGLPAAAADAAEPPPLSRFAERAMADAEKAGGDLAAGAAARAAGPGRPACWPTRREAPRAPEGARARPRPHEQPRRTKPAKQQKPPKPATPLCRVCGASAPPRSPRPRAGTPPRRISPTDEPPRERRLPPHLDTQRRSGRSPAGRFPGR